jgi:MscS family membrane protein
VAFASLAILSELGVSVTSALAGLGIGGIALALGAQKTLEHLLGAFAIAIDQPIREGDFVKIEDFVGTVEAIGLRSTRVRTLDRTIISVPNGKLADMRLETFAARDRFRLATTIGLTYGTTAAQVRQVRDGLEQVLRQHPQIWPDVVSVRFGAFADYSLNVDVVCWFLVKDFEEFKRVREEVLLSFMEVVEKAGCSFAFPTQTVHLVREPTPRAPRGTA